MAAFLIDEDLPRSLAKKLRTAGHAAVDVRDIGMRGKSDREIFGEVQRRHRSVLSADLGFANLLRFPIGAHFGMVVARLPNELPAKTRGRLICDAPAALTPEELRGKLFILEPDRVRIRGA